MKQFLEPEIEVIEVDVVDILTASNVANLIADDLVGWNPYE